MKKIPTILPKDPNNLKLVTNGELLKGIKYFQLKIDGTSAMIKDGILYARYDIKLIINKKGKKTFLTKEEVKHKIPIGAIPCQEPDEKSGHWPHWILVDENPQFKYILEAFNNIKKSGLLDIDEGTYECIGPKIQGNPHNEEEHLLIPHNHSKLNYKIDFEKMNNNPFEYFKNLFKDFNWEGLVAYNDKCEPIGKIRRSDFDYKNNKFDKASDLFNK